MQQIFALWNGLSARRRAIAGLATIAVFAAVLGLTRIATQPAMSLLYAGLDGKQAADVIAALDQDGVVYEIRGQSVFVDSARRDELRMLLAGQGLPANTGTGYELLDNLSGFGTTSQMFDAAYWRAKEGELARTIVANPAIRTARVHIANPSPTPFQTGSTPTASVTVTAMSGTFPAAKADALRYLVSSAVAGLDVSQVTVIDAASGKVISGREDDSEAENQTEAAAIKARVERLLEARVGQGRAIVEVSIDRNRERESIVERRIDPQSRTVISTDTEESVSNSTNSNSAVTVASNLPSGDAGSQGDGSQAQSSLTRERTNFDISEVTRQVTRDPGAIRRLTVAVLVDGVRGPDGWAPRSDIEMEALRTLVASAVGYSDERGDVITLQSLEFDAAPDDGTTVGSGFLNRMVLEPMRLIQLAVFALVALALGLFVVKPILTGRRQDAEAALALGSTLSPPSAQELPRPTNAVPALAQDGGDTTGARSDAAALPPASAAAAEVDPIGRLHNLIEARQPDAIEILKTWIEDDPTPRETA
ncbi:MAG: flagellar basal-body MS-ring/collar protein FliF [Qingshengfaniella sp.]